MERQFPEVLLMKHLPQGVKEGLIEKLMEM